MKDSMFDSEKNDILKDMYGEDVSLLEQEQPTVRRPLRQKRRPESLSLRESRCLQESLRHSLGCSRP